MENAKYTQTDDGPLDNDAYALAIDGVVVKIHPHPLLVLATWIAKQRTGQLTFHFTNGTLRQIQRNVFETVK